MSELAKKYRPKTFKSVFGHDSIKKSLISLLKRPEPPHCYLFHGPPGVGKTTLARICAKKLGCDGPLNLQEHNSAEQRGIDDVRRILSNIKFKTLSGKGHNRAHIFDECHQLTSEAQNCLLKDTEEPPAHIFFFFCTTNKGGIKPTLISRCAAATYELKLLSDEVMFEYLFNFICKKLKQPQKDAEDYAELVTLYANGSPRNALGLVEKIIGLDITDAEDLLKDEVISVDNPTVISLCKAMLFEKRGIQQKKNILKILKTLEKEDPEKLRRAVLSYVYKMALDQRNLKRQKQLADILSTFEPPTYNSGFAGFVRMVLDSF